MKIGELINRGIRKKGINQRELAKMMGVSPPAVANWISGTKNPTADKLIELIKILDLARDFFPESDSLVQLYRPTAKDKEMLDFMREYPEVQEKMRNAQTVNRLEEKVVELIQDIITIRAKVEEKPVNLDEVFMKLKSYFEEKKELSNKKESRNE